jgi:hypothetical protein
MPATVKINRYTGSGPTKTNITGANTVANATDTHQSSATGSSDPIRIPTSGINYSYWVVCRLECTVTPLGTLNNIRWYTDGSNTFGTGVTCKVQTATSYVQATGTAGISGIQLTTGNYPTLAGAPVNAFTYVVGSPLSVSGSLSNPSTGDFGDFVVYQLEVDSTAVPGVTGTETFTWLYDET